MAFTAINAQQELNNRKILEDLQIKKHNLLTKTPGTATTLGASATSHSPSVPATVSGGIVAGGQPQSLGGSSLAAPILQQQPQLSHPLLQHQQLQQQHQLQQPLLQPPQQQQHQQQQLHPHQPHHQQSQHQNDITFNNTSRAAWIQATNQSFCFFLHQDSGYGNSILPVLPRLEPPVATSAVSAVAQPSALAGSAVASSVQ